MRVLLDTNIVARLAEPASPHHVRAQEAVRAIRLADDEPVVVPQVIYEFWVMATRPLNENGLGFNRDAVQKEVAKIEGLFPVLEETGAVYLAWKDLVSRYGVLGKTAHDARLVAAMRVHGITEILTFNKSDFARYEAIRVRTPAEISAS
jgi:predicted nucleic acid-binding protein